jgi:hypothetical protein
MSPFRRVKSHQAGPNALGILVPPGARTLVILRPRSLPWDLLPARWNGRSDSPPAFCTFSRDEAAAVARRLQQALEQAVTDGVNPVETSGDVHDTRCQVWIRTSELVWIVCRRTPGNAYEPAVFTDRDAAVTVAGQLSPICWPAAEGGQEYYFNTQQFT